MSLIKVNNLSTLDGAATREITANTGLTIPAGEDLKISGSVIDSTGSDGNTGQYLTAINGGAQVSWTSLPQNISPTSNVTFNSINVTGDITIGGTANFSLSAFTTTDLTEGNKLYYTNARARAAISATNTGGGDGSILYSNSTGELTYTGPTATNYRAAFSAANTPNVTGTIPFTYLGSLAYSATNGRYTYTGPTVENIRTRFSARNVSGLGSIGYSIANGEITYVGPTNAEIRNLFSAGGDLEYDAATGQFFVDLATSGGADILNIVSNGPLTDLRINNASNGKTITTIVVSGTTGTVNSTAHGFAAGDRISIIQNSNARLNKIYQVQTAATNSFTITVSSTISSAPYPGGLAKPAAVFTGDVVIDGTITVNGTNIGLSDLFVGTSLIKLNSDLPDTSLPSINGDDDAYIQVNRGLSPDTALRWNELSQRWQFTNDGINYNNILLPSETDFGASGEFGASGDPAKYSVTAVTSVVEGALTYKKLTIPNITKFNPNHKIKVFGISQTQNLATSNPSPAAPSSVIPSYESALYANVVTYPHQFYAYAVAQMDLSKGDISAAVPQSIGAIENLNVGDLNEANYNTITVSRSANKAILLYRATFSTLPSASAALNSFSANVSNFKLIAVIGPRYFGGNSNYQYVDYGAYDVTVNSLRDDDGSFGANPIHVPHTASTIAKQGFITCGIKPGSLDEVANTLMLDVPSLYNDASISNIFIYHDDTIPLQTAIDEAVSTGRNFLVIPGGTYLISQLEIPDRFTLRGLADATVLHRQYWDTTKVFDNTKSGAKGSMLIGKNFDATQPSVNLTTGANVWGVRDHGLGDIILDGSVKYQILNETSPLGPDANDAVINFVNGEFVRLQNVKIRQSAGPALYATGSKNLQVDSCTFYSGADVERFTTPCIVAQEGDTTVISNSVFRDFPGPIDVSSTTVLSVNGCTVRNCGSGLRVYGSSKTDVLNNLILGPSDEYIPVPDLYDSEFNSVNLQVQYGINNQTPVFQYIVGGQAVNLSTAVKRAEVFRVTVSNNVETVDFTNTIKASDGSDLFTVINPGSLYNPSIGQIQFEISITNTNYLIQTYPSVPNAYNVYRIYGINYLDYGSDLAPSVVRGTTINLTGGGKAYVITVNKLAYDSVIVGSYIKLVTHSYSPLPVVADRIWMVSTKENIGGTSYTLTLLPRVEDSQGNITNSTLTGVGTEPTVGGGYIRVRDKFIIAKGIISVTL
jgi:hypothetical protein